MERLLNPEERIKRAEEIYARRQSLRYRTKRATVNVNSEKKNFKLFKRLALQIVICILMYCIFYLVNTTNYSFSEIALTKTDEIISYDINFVNIYNMMMNKINSYLLNNNKEENTTNNEENQITDENVSNSETENPNNELEQTDTNTLGLKTDTNEETTTQENKTNVEESLTDKIKKEYSFIRPVSRNCHF